jgi:hypothetical protein
VFVSALAEALVAADVSAFEDALAAANVGAFVVSRRKSRRDVLWCWCDGGETRRGGSTTEWQG